MVSCLISAYYASEFIHIRLHNLQGHERIVVCQAGSNEETIARQFGAEQIITTPDIPTIGKAWNLAYREATHEYVTTANTDDQIYTRGYERMAQVLDDHPDVDLVFSMVDVTSGGSPRTWDRIRKETGIYDAEEIIRRCIIGPMPLWRRNLLDRIGGFEEGMVSADWEYWLRMHSKGAGFYYINKPLGCYARRSDSLEHRSGSQLAREAIILRDKYRMVAV